MYNKVILMGRLTTDPELKQTTNGNAVTSFSIAVDRSYSKGEKKVDFPSIVAWRQTAEFICRYFSKGSAILIEGTLQSRSYVAKDGQNRTVWEVVADQARFTGSKTETQPAATHGGTPTYVPAYSSSASEDFTEIDDDGDLPF